MGAEKYWDGVWADGSADRVWSEPDPWVAECVARVVADGGERALDLGCGIGRHALAMAREGLTVHGLDASPAAIDRARAAADAQRLSADFILADISALPFEDDTFDYVLAYNVVYHGTEESLRWVLRDVRRVLRPGGVYQSTMLSKRNVGYGRGIETSRNTFRQPQAKDDKTHDHLFADEQDLLRLHDGFRLLSADDREHAKPGSYHWHCVFEASEAKAGLSRINAELH